MCPRSAGYLLLRSLVHFGGLAGLAGFGRFMKSLTCTFRDRMVSFRGMYTTSYVVAGSKVGHEYLGISLVFG